MTKQEIKKIKRKNIIQALLGITILVIALLINVLGSKRSFSQTFSFYGIIAGLVFTTAPVINMIRFRKYLRDSNNL